MKILLLSPLPPPVGGIASWTENIISHYSDNLYLDLVNQDISIKHRKATQLSFLSRFYSGIRNSFNVFINFYRIVNKFNPDVLHVNSSGSMGMYRDFIIVFLADFYKIPVVIHFHFGRIPYISRMNNWEWKILKRIVTLSSAVVVLDNETHHVLSASGFKNVFNIPNPISSYIECSISEDSEIGDEKNNAKVKVIFVGHIVKNKGIFELVEACSRLRKVDELFFIGPYESNVKEVLLKLMVDARVEIKFSGVLSKEDVLAQMRSASMLVLPSYSEGFPNVIIEAMAMKCPVIATNVGAIASMLDVGSEKPCGIVIEPKDVQRLVEAIHVMIADTAKMELFKKNAFSKVKEQYTLEKVCSQYEKVWSTAYQQGKSKNV